MAQKKLSTQSVLGGPQYMNVGTSGTPWSIGDGTSISHYPMATILNQFDIGVSYTPRPYPLQGTTLTEANMVSAFVSRIDQGDAIAFHGQSLASGDSHMPGYPASTIGHWITADAYNSYGSNVEVVDCASGLPGFTGVPPKYYVISAKLYNFTKSRGIIF